ncbi:carbohydrate binding domain-containing protein [bacterium]|nr:carbohydrate binding domain-containing protein [bacterium]
MQIPILSRSWFMTGLVFFIILSTGIRAADITVRISGPASGSWFAVCSAVTVTVDITVNSGSVKQVNFYRNGSLAAMDKREPYEGSLKNLGEGYYEIKAGVLNSEGTETFSDPVYFIVGEWMQGNRILNGQFDCALPPWALGNYEGGTGVATIESEADIDRGSAVHVEITNPGTLYWHVQLMQDFPILAGHTYEISFIAEVPDEKEIYIALQQDHSPYRSYLEMPVNLTGNGYYGPYEFVCTEDDPSVEFKFMIAGNDVPVYFDDVIIKDLNMPEVTSVEKNGPEMPADFVMNHYPNPFNGMTRITYELPEPADVTVRIYNPGGALVREWENGRQNGGHHELLWDGRGNGYRGLASGVYLVRIEAVSARNVMRTSGKLHLIQ